MKIEGIERGDMGERSRTVARVTWEDCDRPAEEIYFETEQEFADGLAPGAEPFLVAGLVPAFRHGERRIAVEGEEAGPGREFTGGAEQGLAVAGAAAGAVDEDRRGAGGPGAGRGAKRRQECRADFLHEDGQVVSAGHQRAA